MRILGLLLAIALLILAALSAFQAFGAEVEFHGGEPPIILYFENKTPWPLRISIDGRDAIESTSGRDLAPGATVERSFQPKQDRFGGSSIFLEAKAVVRRWKAEWVLAKPDAERGGWWVGFGEDLHGKRFVVTFKEDNFEAFPWYRFIWENLANFATAAFLAALATMFLLFSLCAILAIAKHRGPS